MKNLTGSTATDLPALFDKALAATKRAVTLGDGKERGEKTVKTKAQLAEHRKLLRQGYTHHSGVALDEQGNERPFEFYALHAPSPGFTREYLEEMHAKYSHLFKAEEAL